MSSLKAKQKTVAALARYVKKNAPEKSRDDLERFIDAFYADASPADVVDAPIERLYRVAYRAWQLAAQRQRGKPLISIDNPESETTIGKRRTAIFLVNDNMPFLVDSLSAGLSALGHEITLLYHPIMVVERTTAGQRRKTLGRATRDSSVGGAVAAESLIYFEIDRRGPKTRAKIEKNFITILNDVYAAVQDWREMLTRLTGAVDQLKKTPPAIPAETLNETLAFLEWLRDDNFTLLGYRYYDYAGDLTDPNMEVRPREGLGILRDPETKIWRGSGGFTHMSPELRHFLMTSEPILITKANVKTNVHRRVHMDYIGVKVFNKKHRVIGEHRFVGLFTSTAYSRRATSIPLLRRKVAEVEERARFDKQSHAGKALDHILETFPRDELIQIDVDNLFETALGILYLQERPRPKVFFRHDPFQRFVSALVYIPRDHYDGEVRAKIGDILASAFNGELSTYYIELSQNILARIHFIIRTRPGKVTSADVETLDKQVADVVKGWHERLLDALIDAYGENDGRIQFYTFERAFSAAYRENFSAAEAVIDLAKLEGLGGDESARAFHLYRRPEDEPATARLKIYRAGSIIALSDCLPMLENLGFKVIEEFPYDLHAGSVGWIHDFLMYDATGAAIDVDVVRARVEEALGLVSRNKADDDGFNALILRAGLDADAVSVLRAYGRYLRQVGLPFSQDYLEDCLVRHGGVAANLAQLFLTQFDPSRAAGQRDKEAQKLINEIETMLEAVTSLDQDRILRAYLNVITASVRTNFYQRGDNGQRPSYFTFKVLSGQIREMPKPVPYAEIFVYGPRVEGIHLRGGLVARGGLRWSDRREDYRTEILGLVKAQMVKNAVIVPVGAKGGFVPRQLPVNGNRDEILAEGIEAYKNFITGLIELTDNIVAGKIIPPANTVRRDGDDPYLVVAADKGTATFSDIANGVSAAHNFWLGDAFASGGSQGYDHKKMGITAKGGWVSVQRHFREMNVNIQEEPTSVIGVGDMSGDVFGNGMLLSQALKLIAAFDHRHIFIDPDPDPKTSFKERERLFNLPRSSWMDYNAQLISKGGGIFDRSAKSITLSPEIKKLLEIDTDKVTPNQLMATILRARADLLWFGGIGTYVKSSRESHVDVGDRANDAIRIDAEALRVKVIGEGANLGMTQAARIAFARRGGRINTDFIDNSAGVDCSDNEVNLKIALSSVVAKKKITPAQRDKLLSSMTDEVAALVLRDNYLQTQAISMAEAQAIKGRDRQARLLRWLERERGLDRRVEGLPSDEEIVELGARGIGLTRPEIAVLLSYAKIALFDALKDSKFVDDPCLEEDLMAAFPAPVQKRFPEAIASHRLRREIIATKLSNAIINRGGLTNIFDIAHATGNSLAEAAASFVIARDVFDMRGLWRSIDKHDYQVAAAVQTEMHIEAAGTLRRQMAWFLANLPQPISITHAIKDYKEDVAALLKSPVKLLPPSAAEALTARVLELKERGVPEQVAKSVAGLEAMSAACDLVQIARQVRRPITEVGAAYFDIASRVGFDWLVAEADHFTGEDHWERLAAGAILDDLGDLQRTLTSAALLGAKKSKTTDLVARWADKNAAAIIRAHAMIHDLSESGAATLSKLGYASRQLRNILIRS